MSITVAGVATSVKTPGRYFKVYPGTSGSGGTANDVCALVGQVLATGSMSAGDVELCGSVTEAKALAGQGSELHLMAKGFFATNPGGVLYLVAVTAGTTASTRTVTFANAATADGYYYVWCNGNKYTLTITNGDSANTMAANLAAGIQAQDWYGDLPFTIANTGAPSAICTFTTKNLGPQTQWSVSCIYQNDADLPGTTTATLAAVTPSGGSDPTLTTALAAMLATRYNYVGCSSLDSTAITAIESHIDTQCGPTVGKFTQWILVSPDTYGNSVTTAQTNANKKEIQVAWTQTDCETYIETVGRMVGTRSYWESSDAAFPFNFQVLSGYRIHHSTAEYPTPTEIENCLNNGLTPIGVRSGNGVIVRSITSYSRDGSTPDYSCLDTACVTVVYEIADRLDSEFAAIYGSKKCAADYSDPTATPSRVVTPSMVEGTIYKVLKQAEADAIVSEITDAIKAQIDAQKNGSVAGRIDFECPVPVMEGLYILAGNVRGY